MGWLGLKYDPWHSIRSLTELGWPAVEAHVSSALEYNYGVPRDLSLIRRHLADILPPGRIYIYGAGSQSLALIDDIRRLHGIKVQGFLDRRADELGMVAGLPVRLPSAATDRDDYDYILLSHLTRETEMAESLISAGIPADKIVCLYSRPDFTEAVGPDYLRSLLKGIDISKIDNVIIRCDRSVIVEEHALVHIFDPKKTLVLLMIRPDWIFTPQFFRSINVHLSIRIMTDLLKMISPKTIYLSTILEFDALSIPVRQACRNAFLIHEIHDWWNLYEDDTLQSAFDMSAERARLARLGEYYSTQHADLIVSNRHGECWNDILREFKVEYFSYFVGFPDDDRSSLKTDTQDHIYNSGDSHIIKIIYAGNLPPPSAYLHFEIDFTFINLFEELRDTGDVLINIFNNGHKTFESNGIFLDYIEKFSHKNATYSPRIPVNELLRRMADFDFGWHCMPYRRRAAPDQAMAITHRFTGYMRGGLPIIIDSGWRLMADLVREYDAGIVLDNPTAEEVVLAARTACQPRLRMGVKQLTLAMQAHNRKTLNGIRTAVETPRPFAA